MPNDASNTFVFVTNTSKNKKLSYDQLSRIRTHTAKRRRVKAQKDAELDETRRASERRVELTTRGSKPYPKQQSSVSTQGEHKNEPRSTIQVWTGGSGKSHPQIWQRHFFDQKEVQSPGRRPRVEPQPRWEAVGTACPELLVRDPGAGATDPFGATSFSINHFHQHLLPLLQRSFTFEQLHYLLPDQERPGWQWISDMVLRNVHGAILISSGLAHRLPSGSPPKPEHLQAHLSQALTTLRHGIATSNFTEALAELNTMIAGYDFYIGDMEAWRLHSLATRNMIEKLGGMHAISPVYRCQLLISVPVVCGRALHPPVFPSSDFVVPDCKKLYEYEEDLLNFDYAPAVSQVPELKLLFQKHRLFLHIFHQELLDHDRESPLDAEALQWIDTRFHHLSIISLEVYFKLYKINPICVSEDQRIQTQIIGILILALTFCHQFIYHHNRTRHGLFGAHFLGMPINTIAFMHIRTHLERLFDMGGRDLLHRLEDKHSVLWALGVLSCCEQIYAKATRRIRAEGDSDWTSQNFSRVLQTLPGEQQDPAALIDIFNMYLYDPSLDTFIAKTRISGSLKP